MSVFQLKLLLLLNISLYSASILDNYESVNFIDGPFSSDINPNLARWSNWAYDYFGNISCEDVFLMSREDCQKLQSTPPEKMNLYFAPPSPDGRYKISLPDGDINKSGAHEVVIAIDPFPTANFGHQILVFFVDFGWTKIQCHLNGGVYMGNGECLTLALKNRCHNLIESSLPGSQRKRNFARRCEINFLPLVYIEGHQLPLKNHLECVDDVAGFSSCPQFRSHNETSKIRCDALATNSYRCFATEGTIQTRCRLLETCDQAVLISGGWNRLTSPVWYKDNLANIYQMLRENGYHKSGIKIFYANGDSPLHGPGNDTHTVFPSSFKLAMRYHIQMMCQSPGCVDTLFIYLNSPTRGDGAALLWDVDSNGIADENEVYTISEFLFDVRDCKGAEQVIVLADQNFSGEIIKSVSKNLDSEAYANVKIYASGEESEYSWNSELTRHWANFRHSNGCVHKVYEASKSTIQNSNPRYFDGSLRTLTLTLAGAPCDVQPPFTQRELERIYFGCQNIPTAIWLRKRLDDK